MTRRSGRFAGYLEVMAEDIGTVTGMESCGKRSPDLWDDTVKLRA